MKCICNSANLDKTGHREDCPAYRKGSPPIIRRAAKEQDLIKIVAQLLKTVKQQQERIEKLEKAIAVQQ